MVWADNPDPVPDEGFHANFKLSSGGESLLLSDSDGTLVDSVEFPELETDTSYGRIPNGTGDFQILTTVTPDDVNTDEGFQEIEVVINEVLSDSDETEDWIELYNNGSGDLDLTGFYLSDDSTNLVLWAFPDDTIIEGGGFLVVFFMFRTISDYPVVLFRTFLRLLRKIVDRCIMRQMRTVSTILQGLNG